MIEFHNVSKIYRIAGIHKVVAKNISIRIPNRERMGLLGRNGAGKSTFLGMIAGTVPTTSGRISVDGSISWTVGYAGSFHRDLSGQQNIRFLARVYGVDSQELIDYAKSIAGLGDSFYLPVSSYSSGMRSRLAFAVSMGIPFDTYLIDEITAVGDAQFKAITSRIFEERTKDCGAIVVSHSMGKLREMCTTGAVLDNGKLHYFDKIDDAIKLYEDIQGQEHSKPGVEDEG